MSGNTITQSALPTTPAAAAAVRPSLALSRAARELGLKRGEFDLAVRLGCIRTLPDEGGGGRRVARAEIDHDGAGSGRDQLAPQRLGQRDRGGTRGPARPTSDTEGSRDTACAPETTADRGAAERR